MTALMGRRYLPMTLGALSLVLLLFGWELLVRVGWLNPFFTSQPTAIVAALVEQIRSGELLRNLRATLQELGAGFGAAIIVGIGLGILAGRYRLFEYILDPFLWFLTSAPLIAFYPLFVIWLGLGAPTVIAIVFLFSVTPIAVNTLSGIRSASPSLLNAARAFGATERDLLGKVILPSSAPMVIAGLRLGIGRAITGAIIAELFGGSEGLGFSIAYYGGLLQTTKIWASVVVIVFLAVICTQGLRAVEARLDTWRPDSGL